MVVITNEINNKIKYSKKSNSMTYIETKIEEWEMDKTLDKSSLLIFLCNFVEENGRTPKVSDININPMIFQKHFGSFNNALLEAKLLFDESRHGLPGFETCDVCGKFKFKHKDWHYQNNQRLCTSCCSHADYKNGCLDPESNTGFGFIGQRVVAKTLGLELKHDCNCSINFGVPYDLYDKAKYGKIDVKSCTFNVKSNNWSFSLHNKKIPDTYVMLGFSYNRGYIRRVWIIDVYSNLMYNKKSFTVTPRYLGLEKNKHLQVDTKPYNDIYHNMSLNNCSVLRSD